MNCSICGVDFDDINPSARFIETATGRPVCLGCNVNPMGDDQDMGKFRDWLNTTQPLVDGLERLTAKRLKEEPAKPAPVHLNKRGGLSVAEPTKKSGG